jgi:hypothetical protein
MGRPNRVNLRGCAYHVLKRANVRMPIFHKEGDYVAFERVMEEALDHVPGCQTSGIWCCGRVLKKAGKGFNREEKREKVPAPVDSAQRAAQTCHRAGLGARLNPARQIPAMR